jgi:Glu-tRNA(Gln) amidotransferase subunit E-like FAD-binding protein
MTDYSELGLRMGLEIHQQLDGKKLFCNCPTIIRKDKPDFSIVRRLRTASGEIGAVDVAARHEAEKGKLFIYQGYNDTTCLLELDEQPPNELNKEALKICLQLCKLLNCEIVDAIQFMRKTVVDGSNTSGFQRTALVGSGGYIEIDGKKIGIQTVCLEEEACQVIERTPKKDVYNLSRLGIPLIEIATNPEITDPEECKKAALQLGMILRSVPGMKRGIGSIRQDVNLSIKNGYRVEIKGFQEVKSIPVVAHNEIKRQVEEHKAGKKGEAHVRKAEPDGTTSFLRPMPGAARMYPETDVHTIVPGKVNVEDVKLISEKVDELKQIGLGKDLADKITKSGKDQLLLELHKECTRVKPAFIAETLVSYEPEILRSHKPGDPSKIKDKQIKTIFTALDEGRIAKDSVLTVLVAIAKGEALDLSKYEIMSDKELETAIKGILKESEGVQFKALIGKAMGKLKGKADAKKVIEMLKKLAQ